MPTAPGFADVSLKLALSGFARPAYITMGVDPAVTDPTVIAQSIIASWLAAGSMNSRLDSTVTMSEAIVRLGTDGGEDIIGSQTNVTPGATITA